LRIGITLAKTLAFATGAAIAAVPSVEVLARNAPPEARHVVIVLDAKRTQIYTARLSRADQSVDWVMEEPAHLDSLAAMLSRSPRTVHLVGEGIPHHHAFIPPQDSSVIVTSAESWRARAGTVAEIGYRMLREGRGTDPQQLIPIYIRRPEAEEKLLGSSS
jgi:tRNA threonylcarbamoyladenosine biosynthesis protein TsaB